MIPVCEPVLAGREEEYVLDCLRTGWISSAGSYIDRFEQRFAEFCGTKHSVACSSGTAGLHLALLAVGVLPGDEVILPDFTLIACANMVILAGAKPVLVDVDRETWCIDPTKIESRITPRTKALMCVHMYGHPCDMDPIRAIARRHGLKIIEDGSQAHGAQYKGRMVGSFGEAGVFSFYGNKILTTGEGGMVTTDDDDVAARLRLLRNQAFTEPRFVHDEIGFNYRLTNLQAAIGLAQVEKAHEKVDKKRSIAASYLALLGNRREIQLPTETRDCRNVYWMFGVVLNRDFGLARDEVLARLRASGVDTRTFFCPLSLQPVYRKQTDPRFPDTDIDTPVSRHLWQNGFYLPSGEGLTEQQIETVAEALLKLCRA